MSLPYGGSRGGLRDIGFDSGRVKERVTGLEGGTQDRARHRTYVKERERTSHTDDDGPGD